MLDDGKFEGSYGVEHVLKPDVLYIKLRPWNRLRQRRSSLILMI